MERRMQFKLSAVVIVLLYLIIGAALDYAETTDAFNTPVMWIASTMMTWVLWITVYLFVAWPIVIWRWSIREWGFTLDRRLWINIFLIVGTSLILAFRTGPGSTPIVSFDAPFMVTAVAGGILEEMIS